MGAKVQAQERTGSSLGAVVRFQSVTGCVGSKKNSSLCLARPELGAAAGCWLARSVGCARSLLEGTALSEIEPPPRARRMAVLRKALSWCFLGVCRAQAAPRCFIIDGTTMVANRWQVGGLILTDLVELYLAAHR